MEVDEVGQYFDMDTPPNPEKDTERTDFTWMIVNFDNWFQQLSVRKKGVRENSLQDTSEFELISEEFTRGQHVRRTCSWQMELSRSAGRLEAALRCNQCYHEDVDEIWARFDTQIIDIHGTVLFSKVRTFFGPTNVVLFRNPKDLNSGNVRYRNWYSELIPMSLLAEKWKEYVPRNILILRLRLYVFREKPAYLQSPPFPNFLPYYSENGMRCERGHGPLCRGIQDLWDTMEGADIMFKISGHGEVLKAHKLILTVQSPILKRRIAEAPKITDTDGNEFIVLELSNRPIQTLKYVLEYFYDQEPNWELKYGLVNIDLLTSVLETCVEFGAKRVADLCLSRLIKSMSVDNFGKIATIIFSNAPEEDPIYKPIVQDFFMRNVRDLEESEEFKKVAKAHPDILLQLCFNHFSIKASDFPSCWGRVTRIDE